MVFRVNFLLHQNAMNFHFYYGKKNDFFVKKNECCQNKFVKKMSFCFTQNCFVPKIAQFNCDVISYFNLLYKITYHYLKYHHHCIFKCTVGSQMLVTFFRWFLDEMSVYALDFWCGKDTGSIFHCSRNQVRRWRFYLKIISKTWLPFGNTLYFNVWFSHFSE